jgi:hypothetical protein
MKARDSILRILLSSIFLIVFTATRYPASAESPMKTEPGAEQGPVGPETNPQILVEIFLSADRKGDLDEIKKAFEAVSITRVRAQFFRAGNPPENIAIGKSVPASVARLAIRLAIIYNRGIKYLLPEYRYFPDHIAIGTSAFDEASQIPVRPQDLERLSDQTLTTEQFHKLYRHLTGEDKRLPTYIP